LAAQNIGGEKIFASTKHTLLTKYWRRQNIGFLKMRAGKQRLFILKNVVLTLLP
jgi:hypothetical protein